ncbi:hypothetical protein NDN08_002701 [Rhodosorus marinus]|uniref:Uncharacterized protein n=1 Tax=Rhodosorus marinus TaxID=101924 RepID=A0AAV8V090_9RHOD|nr:hypothetical protein NDN08_002701 [Rhodosorus marinus]
MESNPLLLSWQQFHHQLIEENSVLRVEEVFFKVKAFQIQDAGNSGLGTYDLHGHGWCLITEERLLFIWVPVVPPQHLGISIPISGVVPQSLRVRDPFLGATFLRGQAVFLTHPAEAIELEFTIQTDRTNLEMAMNAIVGLQDGSAGLPDAGNIFGDGNASAIMDRRVFWNADATNLFQLVEGYLPAEIEASEQDVQTAIRLMGAETSALVDPHAPQQPELERLVDNSIASLDCGSVIIMRNDSSPVGQVDTFAEIQKLNLADLRAGPPPLAFVHRVFAIKQNKQPV